MYHISKDISLYSPIYYEPKKDTNQYDNYYNTLYLNNKNTSHYHGTVNYSYTFKDKKYEDIADDESTSDSGIVINQNQEFPESIANWNSDQVMKWILDLYDAEGIRYEDLNLHYFRQKDGRYLMKLTVEDWDKIDKNRSKFLYEKVQQLVRDTLITDTRKIEAQTRLSVISYSSGHSIQSSGYHSDNHSSDEEILRVPYVRKRGRPRSGTAKRRNSEKLGRVWEFLRDLLLNPKYCPKIICWEDYQSRVFRLVDGNEVARMWGEKKKNPNMNYGKFSRSIRHYYKLKVIESVCGKRYVYKFGENAVGCETNNPNFGIHVNKTNA